MNRAKLKQLVEDIEGIETDIAKLSKDKRELLKAHAGEFDPKAVRKVIARRKIDGKDRESEDFLVASYEVALGMAGNLAKEVVSGSKTYEEAAEEAGVSRRTIARHVARERGVPKATDDGTAHDPDTGEIIAETQVVSAPAGGGDVDAVAEGPSATPAATPLSSGGMGEAPVAHAEGVSTTPKPTPAAPLDTRSFDEIAGEIPAHLRRVRAA